MKKKVAFSVTPNIVMFRGLKKGTDNLGMEVWHRGSVVGSQLRETDTFVGETSEGITQKMHKERDLPS